VIGDVAGFAAATLLRGVAVAHVPTTLLAMVDSAIGGKTGVNLPEGKNLVGAFWQPTAVICDTDTLATLPPREYRSGLGELAKYHFLSGDRLDDLDLEARVAKAVEIKATFVAADERETSGVRATLNYGHTMAHAAELAGAMGRITEDRIAYHRAVVAGYDLPIALPRDANQSDLLALMARDKKAVDGLTFVLDGPEGVEPVAGIDPTLVEATLGRIAADG
jgi:5-deoxy-5-amino-3-dehydroquinate synthase